MNMLYYLLWILNIIVNGIIFRPKIIGKENIPKKGAAIIAANHSDVSDPIFLCMTTRRRIYYFCLHDAYYYGKNAPAMVKWILRWTNQIPVIQGQKKSGPAIRKAIKLLKDGRLFAIFPEGTVKGGEKITEAHRGVARIALESRTPIIPVGLVNTYGILPKGKNIYQKIPRIKIHVGKPVYYEKYYGKQNNQKITKFIADDVMNKIEKLCTEIRDV